MDRLATRASKVTKESRAKQESRARVLPAQRVRPALKDLETQEVQEVPDLLVTTVRPADLLDPQENRVLLAPQALLPAKPEQLDPRVQV